MPDELFDPSVEALGQEPYDPSNWFWEVKDRPDVAWSSANGAYVDLELAHPKRITKIASEQELTDVLAAYGIRGPLVTIDDVIVERARRLAMGFDFDFKDARGVHRIGTSAGDLVGWDEVSKLCGALVILGMTDQMIPIVTDTGSVAVTPIDWQKILLAAAAFRQPLWFHSFVLQAMSPIPNDYTDDKYWK